MTTHTTSTRVGTILDERYLIRTEIGTGNFGVVFRGRDLDDERDVAIKTLQSKAASVPELVQRIAREVDICMQLTNRNTARLLNYGIMRVGAEESAVPYLVFELVRGIPLGDLLESRGKMTLDEAVHVMVELLGSLSEAHGVGIIHRDLKPNNVLLQPPQALWREPAEEGTLAERLGIPDLGEAVWHDLTEVDVRVVDFGLGKILSPVANAGPRLTTAGTLAGTAHYMSPEQAQGLKDIDYRSDIYGVAMLLKHVLTGSTAYPGDNSLVVAMRQINEELPPLPAPWSGHPVAEVYARAGAKRREDRYGSAEELAWDLRCLVDEELAREERPDFATPAADAAPRKPLSGLFRRLFGRGE